MTNLNELQQIREFVQIADSGSISAATKILGISQPTLSRHLAALETQIGSPLVRGETQTMSFTEAGCILSRTSARRSPSPFYLTRPITDSYVSKPPTQETPASP